MFSPFDFQPRTRLIFGLGSFARLGELARESGFRRTLLVADRGMVGCGYVEEAVKLLAAPGVEVFTFHDFTENPDTDMIEAGRAFAAGLEVDSIIGLGGGSSLDSAKGINFVLTNGGHARDYWGYGKATRPMLPMIGVPTTSGTGSEAQSYALISDAETHVKMACGDPQAAFKAALLDPQLTVTQPRRLSATAGFDALAHAVETYVTAKCNPLSDLYSREAWRLLEANFERVLDEPGDLEARAAMQLGAHLAGMAIENSMLGAAHASANPLTARYGTAHGDAVALLLPHVVRWNALVVGERYAELLKVAGRQVDGLQAGEALARRLERLARAGGLPQRLAEASVPRTDLPLLAAEAAKQWTGTFNPRRWDAAGALEVYECAF
jgi:alcohol dehydrogenase